TCLCGGRSSPACVNRGCGRPRLCSGLRGLPVSRRARPRGRADLSSMSFCPCRVDRMSLHRQSIVSGSRLWGGVRGMNGVASAKWLRLSLRGGAAGRVGAASVWARSYVPLRLRGSVGHMTTHGAAGVLVRALVTEGVESIFGVPGGENIYFPDSARPSSIAFVLTRHEQAAAFMAATYGRLTGRPGVCLTTLGPGALNLATGAAYAHLGGMPVIMITGQKGIRTAEQAAFQMVNTVATMDPLTKESKQITSAAMIPTMVRDAFRVAQAERPGPVHLELPEDIAGLTVDGFEL